MSETPIQPDARGLRDLVNEWYAVIVLRPELLFRLESDLVAWCHRQCERQIKACAASILEVTEDIRAEAAVAATPIVEIDL